MKIIKVLSLIIVLLYSIEDLKAQALNGMSGLFEIPSARMMDDGEIILGFSYIPFPYFTGTGGVNKGKSLNPGLNSYLTYSILPFVEIMFRYTHELNVPVNTETLYFPDRMFGVRFKILEENKFSPAIVVGLNDPSSLIRTSKTATHFSSSYISFNKVFEAKFGYFDLTFGRSFKFKNLEIKENYGFFGGVSFYVRRFNNFHVVSEVNSKHFNFGIKHKIYNGINYSIGLLNMKKLFYSLNFKL